MKLELRGITKRFGTLVANDAIDLVVEPGQIHCLLGENGAGKSTLMNVLYGLLRADAGQILLDGAPQRFDGPGDAMRAGIGMVHQHFMLVPVLTVAENVVLGDEDVRGPGWLDMRTARRRVREISERFGFDLDPDALVGDLPVGVQQRVEIVKALARDARVLVLDEPTAVLTPQETDELMATMRRLADAGTALVFITHKLREVREVADRITVIRHGRVAGAAEPGTTTRELARLMVGRDVTLTVDRPPARPRGDGLRVDGLTVRDASGRALVDDVTLQVRGGEVLGIAGVQGNGQTELVEAITGLRAPSAGTVRLGDDDLTRAGVRAVLAAGVGHVPEDRTHDGLVGEFSIAENLVLDRSFGPPFVRRGEVRRAHLAEFARQRVDEFDVRTSSIRTQVRRLSGGNQQKVVIARELARPLRLLVAAQPTRGVDVGSIEFIHRRIVETRDAGTAVVVVSTEIDEVLGLADRIAVMYRGRVVGVVPAGTSREVLGLMMAGTPIEETDAA
ncbi:MULTISPECIES: ABC transporter ATP-binding protein [Cellulomonas]|uniref:Simple sugar transport system ATP-binding protein n=1 Tax=Cellulomonas iranensis TaxID=76862 RepID=A0ABU0GFW6_9CELL|nr:MULTISPECIES: ABC transporter ATP-binding protein [Cellulomonas]MDQ0424198.1 simple sugar transport system ATP-binding protein [Cellulomonas iranensis]TFH72977.1 ABC transporter ATP-binding protein [Cellulomonas sp. HD19AZ1]